MKRYMITFGLILVHIFCVANLKAITPKSVLLFSITAQNKARLGVVNTGERSMTLSMTDINGQSIFSKTISSGKNFFQILDLSNIPNGKYALKLSGNDVEDIKNFTVNNLVVSIDKPVKESRPVFTMPDSETLVVTYLNTEGTDVNIFFELNEEVVFADKNLVDMPISKKYSLKKLPQGDYQVKLYSNGKIFQYPLAVK